MQIHMLAGLLSSQVAGTFVFFHLVLFCVFLAVYASIDFGKHFSMPPDLAHAPRRRANPRTVLYHALTVQATFGTPNDMVPCSQYGRMLVSLHASLSWMQSVTVLMLAQGTSTLARVM